MAYTTLKSGSKVLFDCSFFYLFFPYEDGTCFSLLGVGGSNGVGGWAEGVKVAFEALDL